MIHSAESLRKKLADYIIHTSFENLTAEVIWHAKLCVLDLIGVSIAGSRQKTSKIIKKLFSTTDGNEEATIWSSHRKVPIQTAALVNAVQAHAIDMDDGHRFANGHPGVVTIPAAVAIAEKEHLTGRELIEAVVTGYQIFISLGSAINPDLLLRGFHTTATIGPFASAAVASKLLGLNGLQTENALALSGLQSAGLLEALSSGEMGKSFQVGKAVQGGVLAGLLAQQGADGPENIFEGEKGFFRAFAGKQCDNKSIGKDLETDFKITKTYCKQHAACRHMHSALDATAAIVSQNDFGPEEIVSIEIETYSIAKSLTGHLAEEGSELAAKFSTPVAIAILLVYGQSGFSAFSREYISNPMVQSLAKKITVTANPDRDKYYPDKRSASVTVLTKTRSYTHEVDCPKGEPENPLSEDEFMDKYEENSRVLYSNDQTRSLKDLILNIENSNICEMTEMLIAPSVL
jgi:2-methylcitrate dehydratase PrpD